MVPPTQRGLSVWLAASVRFCLAAGVAVAGMALSMTAVLVTRDWSSREIPQRVGRAVADRCAVVRERLRDLGPMLVLLRDVNAHTRQPDEKQFEKVAATLLAHQPGVIGLHYASRVDNSQRATPAAAQRQWHCPVVLTRIIQDSENL